ncbi:alpha/beta fold hydrolase [Altererythrobacter xixiisoli]|uniref:Alpha/beta fold hydrolase n=1 Tax=Croceibacterium xixiisoli TaxID=1476466 RepID=A0A6I4TT30_9SPHN|nr:alpha/beta hydrolase [Croceibacterium xixiisoli]MXO97523.1 alpha/beta fold hydrolase [Croceibacterium xixiisoli]
MEFFRKLSGRRSGLGRQVAVLAHGFGTDQSAWSSLRPWFDARYDVISFDLAGCGARGAETYDFDRHGTIFGYADDLIDLIDEIDTQNIVYVGHSMSGMIGAAAACARPGLFDRLVMIGASPRYLNDGDYFGGFEQSDLDQLFDSMAANFQAWVAGFAPMVVGVPDNTTITDFSRTLCQMQPDIALNISRTIFSSDMRQTATRIRRPVHLIQTSADMAVPTAVGTWLANAIPGATLDVIDAAGHLPHMTAANEVQRILDSNLLAKAA